MKFIKCILFLLILQAVAFNSRAVHIKGGWMYYEYLGKAPDGNNNYKLVVKVYRDCAPPNTNQNDVTINIAIYRSDNSLFGSVNAPRSNLYNLEKQTFSECINPKPQVCYVILEYSTTVSLPPSAGGYIASFQRCCRINGIVNVNQPSNSYGNTYTIRLPGTATANSVENSSPKFVEKDTVAVCYSSPIVLDYSATDPDGDSLVYSFAPALLGGSQTDPNPVTSNPPPYPSIPYGPSYSSTDPFGTQVKINPQTGIITGLSPATTGEYVLSVAIQEYRGGVYIAETRKELHVNVAACSIAGAELPLRITSCDGYTVEFENLSSSPAINSYYWDFGETILTTDTSTLPKPTYTYSDTGVFTAKLVVNRNSSCVDSATSEVRVFPGFFPDFTYTGSCFANPFQFRDLSSTRYGVISNWRWNFGDLNSNADTSVVKNPSFKYPAIGTYNVLLEVASDKGCSDTISKQITVLDKPVLDLPFRDTLICSIDSLVLKATGTGNFSWSPAFRMINANTANPTVFPLLTTTYTVSLNDRGCIATDTVRVNVLDFITVNAGKDTTICLTDAFQLKPVSQGLKFVWTPAAGLSDPNIKNPVVTPINPANPYTVTVNLGKCQAQDDIIISTVPYPLANAGPDTAICFGDTAILRGSGSGTNYLWSSTGAMSSPGNLQIQAFPFQTTAYVLSSFANLGCPKPGSDTVLVTVIPRVSVFAGRDTTIVIGQPLQLNGQSNGSIFKWTPATGMNNAAILNPLMVLNGGSIADGGDKIRFVLQVSTPEGCTASDDIVISLFRTAPSIFVPSAFTPNNDGRNDQIKPILAGMKELVYFRIYNRYGQLLFETREQGRGWDGRIKGELQGSNGFVYSCQAIDYNGKTILQNGSFVLVR